VRPRCKSQNYVNVSRLTHETVPEIAIQPNTVSSITGIFMFIHPSLSPSSPHPDLHQPSSSPFQPWDASRSIPSRPPSFQSSFLGMSGRIPSGGGQRQNGNEQPVSHTVRVACGFIFLPKTIETCQSMERSSHWLYTTESIKCEWKGYRTPV
jgi:hypothetical protein